MKKILILGVVAFFFANSIYGATTDLASDASGASLSQREKLSFSERAVSELDSATKKVLRMIEDAQKAKNIMLLNCLNEKLAALRGLLKIGEDAAFGLSEAVARENADLQEHNFRKIFISRNQGLTVAAEATACVGDSAGAIGGGTRVVVTVDGGDDDGGDENFGSFSNNARRSPDGPMDEGEDTQEPAEDARVTKLRKVGLLPAKGTVSEKDIKTANKMYKRLTNKRLEKLKADVKASNFQYKLRQKTDATVSANQQKADAFLSRNWIDIHGDVVQLSTRVLRPNGKTIQKIEYTYRVTGNNKGTSIFSNRVTFNKTLPLDWTNVYNSKLNDAANLTTGSPEYWRSVEQISMFTPEVRGCALCFTSQYNPPGPVPGGGWGQPKLFFISYRAPGQSISQVLLTQTFDAAGTLVVPSANPLDLVDNQGTWQYQASGTNILNLQLTLLSELGRSLKPLTGGNQGWKGLLEQIDGNGAGTSIELVFTRPGSTSSIDLLVSPTAFLEAFK